MSSIAYITDSTMLENHRLLENKTMNFWRLSTKINFSDFRVGDLVFFLSKDKVHRRKGEKGIVGFGRLKELRIYSPGTMWRKYGKDNGFNTRKEFEDALIKISKDNQLPTKISSMYLEDIVFFQTPTYLSEYGMKISKQVESYVYIDDLKVAFNILEYAKKAYDTWTSEEDITTKLDEAQIRLALFNVQHQLPAFKISENTKKAIHRKMKNYIKEHPDYEFISDNMLTIFNINENHLTIVLDKEKEMDDRMLIGQAYLYRYYLLEAYPYDLDIIFKEIDDDNVESILKTII